METTRTATSGISREKFVSFISGLTDRYPNPEGDPQPECNANQLLINLLNNAGVNVDGQVMAIVF